MFFKKVLIPLTFVNLFMALIFIFFFPSLAFIPKLIFACIALYFIVRTIRNKDFGAAIGFSIATIGLLMNIATQSNIKSSGSLLICAGVLLVSGSRNFSKKNKDH